MLTKATQFAGAVLAALFLGGPASAQDASITDYSPSNITTGTVITINGDFADMAATKISKPKVFGTSGDTKAKVILKVLTNTATEITAEVKKVPTSKTNPAAGTMWTLNVQPKGKGAYGATTSASLMTVVAPFVLDVDPPNAMPGDEVTVTIDNAGSKPPKAKIGGKNTKLKAAPGGEIDGDAFIAKVPKSIANGTWNVEVDNKIGTDTSVGALTVTGSNKKIGKAVFTATINGAPYKSSGKFLAGADSGVSVVVAANLKQNNPQRSFNIAIPFKVGTDTPPVKYLGFPATLLTFVYSETTLNGLIPTIISWQPASSGAISVTVNAVSGGQLAGSFTGMLVSPGQPNLAVEGEFVVDL